MQMMRLKSIHYEYMTLQGKKEWYFLIAAWNDRLAETCLLGRFRDWLPNDGCLTRICISQQTVSDQVCRRIVGSLVIDRFD
jgi:hypothetical protein